MQRILIVEDNVDMAEVYRAFLSRCEPDAAVTVARTYAEGLRHLGADPPGFDLVITDLRLPTAPWPELLGVYQLVQQTDAPVMVCTGVDPSLEHQAYQYGATMFFFKPHMGYQKFSEAVHRLLALPPDPPRLPAGSLVLREAGVARREEGLGSREAGLAHREEDMARREERQAQREDDVGERLTNAT